MLQLNEQQISLYDNIIELKKRLHQYFYPNYISELISDISSNIDLFNIEVGEDFSIVLKIKKTSIKKFGDYSHDSSFYYNIMNELLLNFLQRNINTISTIVDSNMNLSNLINSNTINLYYNITTLGDNIICIYL